MMNWNQKKKPATGDKAMTGRWRGRETARRTLEIANYCDRYNTRFKKRNSVVAIETRSISTRSTIASTSRWLDARGNKGGFETRHGAYHYGELAVSRWYSQRRTAFGINYRPKVTAGKVIYAISALIDCVGLPNWQKASNLFDLGSLTSGDGRWF